MTSPQANATLLRQRMTDDMGSVAITRWGKIFG
jgi:hypothetical protein